MRAISTAYDQLLKARGGTMRRLRVSVKDSGGTFRDLTTYLGSNFLLAGSWGESVDDNGFEADFEVLRNQHKVNLSPYMTTSPANLGFAYPGVFAPLIDVGREILVEWAVAPSGTPASALTWVIGMRGHIDSHDPTDGRVRFTARGRFGQVLDAFIENERVYAHADTADPDATKGLRPYVEGETYAINELVLPGEAKRNGHFYKVTAITTGIAGAEGTYSIVGGAVVMGGITLTDVGVTTVATGTALETVLQQIVNDNMSAPITINTPASPGWMIKWFLQQRTGTWSALRVLVDQIGWDLRDVWNAGLGDLRFELRDPNRAKVAPDRTFGSGDRYTLTRLEKRLDGIRNVIKVWYYDSADLDVAGNPKKKSRVVTSPTSIAKYGRRFMEVAEAATSTIDTTAEADAFANAMLSDLSEPNAEQELELSFFPFAELCDLYRFSGDGKHYDQNTDLAVVSYRHRFVTSGQGASVHTSITCRGKPSTGYERWLTLDAGRNKETHRANVSGKYIANIPVVTGGPGAARAKAAETFAKHALPNGIDWHFSKTASFAPTGNTLRASGYSNMHQLDGDPGDTYYGALVPWHWNDQKKSYGAKSEEFTIVPGYLEPKHINPEKFRMELPPNGSFEGFTREEGLAVPPDNWEMQTGVWNTDVQAGPIKGGPNARDGAKYLRFMNTNLRTAVRTKWFPVNGGHLHSLKAWVYRNGGANGFDLQIEWVDATKAAISTSTFTRAFSTLVDSAWNRITTRMTAPVTAAFARFIVEKSAVSTDQFNIDGVQIEDVGEDWHSIGAAGEPTFQNSWVNFGGNYAAAAFRKDAFGWVHLKGVVKTGTIGATIFVLPAGYLRAEYVYKAVESNNLFGIIEIQGNTGNVVCQVGNNAHVSLDCISFLAD
jgi:hypothetical protein